MKKVDTTVIGQGLFCLGFMKRLLVRGIGLGCITVWLTACSTGQVLVSQAYLEAADQCLAGQQSAYRRLATQDQQLLETLRLLRQSLEQQESKLAVDEIAKALRAEIASSKSEENCTIESPSSVVMASDKLIVGRRERILLTDLGLLLQARVDTGAVTSSLDARNIEVFERNGEEWVRFTIHNPETDEPMELERKRVRGVLITQSNSPEAERRSVVEMRVTLGSVTQMAEFTLTDRSHLDYQLLVGRNILQDLMLVDVAQSNVLQPTPPEPSDNGRGTDE